MEGGERGQSGQILSFRDLRVWQAGMDLVELIYRTTAKFPSDEDYALTGQLRRAAISIPSNIAEGHTREHSKEYLHHLSMAQASLAELVTQLEIAARLGYVSKEKLNDAMLLATRLAKQLYALRNAVVRKDRAEEPRLPV